ncbi:hypothetical protein D9613_007585 [Agrocybe pediades]|uniref:Uncharacterized protein n=1 Tax=Agrocybe pediades TaxID=84607 RepID=A0A8H4VKH6_9AGAR|nr:hypothetical protein D9613_007585 [Agrocybe pediades]
MSTRSKEGLSNADRERERQRFRTKLATALSEEDDPLALYHQFVQWTIKNYGESDPTSGLVELLKEATMQFKDDALYKTDLRYLKLWALYARQVDKVGAIAIYAYLVEHDIGTSYAALYEDYASLLERTNKRNEADSIFRKGIKKSARPLERLKTRYQEFLDRGTPLSSSSQAGPSKPKAGPKATSSSSTTPVSTTTFNSTAASRYALMLAPPPPGKRPEKLRFNMSLLFTEEAGEFSIQEARARSMGLLGKKWGPPPAERRQFSPASTSSTSSVGEVDFNDDGHKTSKRKYMGRRSIMGGAEPTVTINTKEALEDVFGMYNLPDRTTKMIIPGSKHAPLKKIEPITPSVPPRPIFTRENENADRQPTKTPTTFRPFTDENAQPGASRTPAAKFTPFVDPNAQRTPFMTPRTVLTVKETSHPPSNLRFAENASENEAKPAEKGSEPIYAKVFTPASKAVPLAPLRDVFTDDHGKPIPKAKVVPTHERAKSQSDNAGPPNENFKPIFTPFKDENANARTPFKVFSRAPEQAESSNVFTPKTPSAAFKPFSDAKPTPAFTPFNDVTPAFTAFSDPNQAAESGMLPPEPPAPSVAVDNVIEIQDDDEEQVEEHLEEEESPEEFEHPHRLVEEEEQEEYYEEEESQIEEYDMPLPPEHLPEEDYEEEDSEFHEPPLGGRFGQFNVMTPITERTFEFTSSMRGGTPSDRNLDDTQRAEAEAARAALLLAEELRETDSEEYEEDVQGPIEPLRLDMEQPQPESEAEVVVIEEKAGSLSLLDTLTLSSNFRPANPCNPFDPAIISVLLSRISPDPHFFDLRNQTSGKLEELQKFTKKNRKTSSSSSSGVLSSGSYSLVLQGNQFMVTEKLGEGGFGCVFKARDKGMRPAKDDDDDEEEDEEDEDDEDEEASSMVALKVVKPRNIWEYHVLRRLHSALPPSLRRSVVLPHALYAYSDESHLVLDLCPQGMLLNIVNNAVSAGVSQAGACLDELLVVFFTIELLRLLETMHRIGFIHGDLKIDNCLLRLEEVPGGAAAWSGQYSPTGEGGWCHKGLKVIDFGRTIDMRLFPPDQQFVADWATDDRDCFEVRENRPWTYQTDYFGLAGIIYCMLFGKYIQASSVTEYTDSEGVKRHKIATPFKRYWQSELWNRLFDILLNPCLVRPEGQLPVCDELGEVRKEMEKWLQTNCNRTSNTLKGLLKKVELSCYKL